MTLISVRLTVVFTTSAVMETGMLKARIIYLKIEYQMSDYLIGVIF